MRTSKGSSELHQAALMVVGVVVGALFAADCMSQSLWKESQSLRAYDGPARPREELALVRCGFGLTAESIDGKAAKEYAKAAGQKEILTDVTEKERWFKYSPHRINWPYGYLLVPGEHMFVVVSRSGLGASTLKFVAERGQEYKLTYEEVSRSTAGVFITVEAMPMIVQLSTKTVVSTPVDVSVVITPVSR